MVSQFASITVLTAKVKRLIDKNQKGRNKPRLKSFKKPKRSRCKRYEPSLWDCFTQSIHWMSQKNSNLVLKQRKSIFTMSRPWQNTYRNISTKDVCPNSHAVSFQIITCFHSYYLGTVTSCLLHSVQFDHNQVKHKNLTPSELL